MALDLTAEGTVTELVDHLAQVEAGDAMAERAKKRSGWGIFLCILVGIAGLAVLPQPANLVVGALALAGFVACIVWYLRQSRVDYEDRKLDVARQLLQVLGQDIPRKAKCHLVIRDGAFTPLEREELGGRRKEADTQRWLELRGGLHDGTAFGIAIDQTERRLLKLKPGKGWRQKRCAVQETVTLKLRLDAGCYPAAPSLGALVGSQVEGGLTVSRVRMPSAESPALSIEAEGPIGALAAQVYRAGNTGFHQGPDPRLSAAHVLGLMAHVWTHLGQSRVA
ncbi:MAG TPA: hypothetical protein PLD23_13145 [Armatimonadota bacterium]|nr:hypothetical protein [Armatimonadota bacterium]